MIATQRPSRSIESYLKSSENIDWIDHIPCARISSQNLTVSLAANAQYFGHPSWSTSYLEACHRGQNFVDRWQAAIGSWDGKVVVDIGCGPGNVFAALKGQPKQLIGVDISLGGLKIAQELGYQPLCADAQQLPLKSEIADLVVINATIHHCDDMQKALSEAARLVKPGGLLVSDHDLQKTAWHFTGLARWIWEMRLPFYRWVKRGGHASKAEQDCALATEVHHNPGDGLSAHFYHSILEPMGFSVQVYPHNHDLGSSVLEGHRGRAAQKYRIAQLLSGINRNSPEAALSLMCVAHRKAV